MMDFTDTIELERSLLRLITSSGSTTRLHIHQLKDDWFTSKQRLAIYIIADDIYQTSKSHLTKKVFEYEVGSKIGGDVSDYIAEWNMIEGIGEPPESVEVLIDKLREADVGRQITKIAEEAISSLEKGDITKALSDIKSSSMRLSTNKDAQPTRELTDYEHRKQLVKDKKANPEKYLGLKTGFPTIDSHTGGLFPQELTLIAGLTGLGKSTFCKALARNVVMLNPGKNVLHIANEESQVQVETKYDSLMTGIPYSDLKLARVDDSQIATWDKVMTEDLKDEKVGRIFIKEVPAFTDVTLVEQAAHELEGKGIKIDLVIIDHLPHVKPIEKTWSENDDRAKAATDCKEIARWLNVPVITPTQAATDVDKKQERGSRAGNLDVYGSKGQIHVANTFAIITKDGVDEDMEVEYDWQRDVLWTIDFKKVRDGAKFHIKAKHTVKTGRVTEIIEGAADAMKALDDLEDKGKSTVEREMSAIDDIVGGLDLGSGEDEDDIFLTDDSESVSASTPSPVLSLDEEEDDSDISFASTPSDSSGPDMAPKEAPKERRSSSGIVIPRGLTSNKGLDN